MTSGLRRRCRCVALRCADTRRSLSTVTFPPSGSRGAWTRAVGGSRPSTCSIRFGARVGERLARCRRRLAVDADRTTASKPDARAVHRSHMEVRLCRVARVAAAPDHVTGLNPVALSDTQRMDAGGGRGEHRCRCRRGSPRSYQARQQDRTAHGRLRERGRRSQVASCGSSGPGSTRERGRPLQTRVRAASHQTRESGGAPDDRPPTERGT